MYLRHGFPGERLHVLPRPLITEALKKAPTSQLLVTDAGYFPRAARHGRIRRSGTSQAIVILCAEGAGWCELETGRHDVTPGQFLIIPPHVPHSYYANAAHPWSIWWLHVTGVDAPHLLSAVGLSTTSPTAPLADPIGIFDLVEGICDDLAADETSSSLIAAAGGAWHLLAKLAAQRSTRSVNHEPIARVQRYLREHLTSTTTVVELAEIAGFSTSYFSSRFRSATGYTVVEYIRRLRMARARQLLITTNSSIAEVAAAVGYSDPFYFTRQFTTVNQVSPRTFRQRASDEAATFPSTDDP